MWMLSKLPYLVASPDWVSRCFSWLEPRHEDSLIDLSILALNHLEKSYGGSEWSGKRFSFVFLEVVASLDGEGSLWLGVDVSG